MPDDDSDGAEPVFLVVAAVRANSSRFTIEGQTRAASVPMS
ncbi:hypothetical protein ACVH9Z_41040 [Rhodococcus opacus]|nr:hypothetical protein [Rhodococcus opacus]